MITIPWWTLLLLVLIVLAVLLMVWHNNKKWFAARGPQLDTIASTVAAIAKKVGL